MTCGFSVSPGKLSFAGVLPTSLSPGCIARFSGPSRHPPATRPPLLPRTDLPSPLPSGPMGVAAQHHPNPMNTMLSFLARFAALVRGVLSGFDRLFFCGSLRRLSHCRGLQHYLWEHRIPYKDFRGSQPGGYRSPGGGLPPTGPATRSRDPRYPQLRPTPQGKTSLGRSPARDRIKEGLICVLRSVDPCMSFQSHKNHRTHKLEIQYRQRKCLHLYHYQIHPIFGFMHTRIQTLVSLPRLRLPQRSRVGLARQMDQAGLRRLRCAATTRSPGWKTSTRAQALLDQQAQANWPQLLDACALAWPTSAQLEILARFPCHYYWSVSDSEWASDVLFPSPEALATVYPRLLRYAITTFTPVDVMRFLGQPVPASGRVPHACRHEISSNIKERREAGYGSKHWLNGNSLEDVMTRVRCCVWRRLIRDPGDFKVYRPLELRRPPGGPRSGAVAPQGGLRPAASGRGQPGGQRPLTWGRCWTAVEDTTPLRQLVEPRAVPAGPRPRAAPPQPSRPTDRVRRRGRRVGSSPAAGRPAAVQGFRAGRGFHAGPRVPRRHRQPTGPAPASAADGAASASAADGAASASAARRGPRPAPLSAKGVALGPGGCGR